jgi:hypothetical protein
MKKQIVICLLVVSTLFAQEKGGFDTKGSFYSDLSLLHYRNSDTKDSLGFSGMSTLSLNMRNRNRKFAKVDGAFELKLPYGAFDNSVSLPDDNTSEEIEQPLGSDYILASLDGSVILLDIRRLYSAFYFNQFELSIGRQNIDFGQGMIFSPIDQFSSVDVSDFRFRKNGEDVVHLEVPFNNLWGVTGTMELPYGEREHSSALKLFGTVGSFDLSTVVMYRHLEEAILPGISFKGDAFVGLYGEGVVKIPTNDSSAHFDGMVGMDYSVASKWFFVAEYQFLGNDSRHSLFGAANYTINELLAAGASVIHSVTDNSSLATAQVTWNALQNADFTFFVRGYNNEPFGDGLPMHDLDYSLRATVKF